MEQSAPFLNIGDLPGGHPRQFAGSGFEGMTRRPGSSPDRVERHQIFID